jgi:hypothetical protein
MLVVCFLSACHTNLQLCFFDYNHLRLIWKFSNKLSAQAEFKRIFPTLAMRQHYEMLHFEYVTAVRALIANRRDVLCAEIIVFSYGGDAKGYLKVGFGLLLYTGPSLPPSLPPSPPPSLPPFPRPLQRLDMAHDNTVHFNFPHPESMMGISFHVKGENIGHGNRAPTNKVSYTDADLALSAQLTIILQKVRILLPSSSCIALF